MILNETFSATLTGTSATGLGVALTPAFSVVNANVGDYLHNVYTVNPLTSDVVISLGKILTATYLVAVCDRPLTLTLVQAATVRTIDVNGFIALKGDFTEIRVTNADATLATELMLFIAGDRAAVGVGPGVYSK